MRRFALLAVLLWLPSVAGAQQTSARALLAFQQYHLGDRTTSGFRQTYDLHLQRAFTMTSLVRLIVRGDDFRGTSQFASTPHSAGSRQIQPIGEFILNTTNIHAQLRGELFDTRSRDGTRESSRHIDRLTGQMTWQPDGLPTLTLRGQRSDTNDDAAQLRLRDDNAYAELAYGWRDVHATVSERYIRSADPLSGYDRRMGTHVGDLTYATTRFDGRLSVSAEGSAQLSRIDERAGAQTSSIPTPVAISRALYGIDDTPTDDRDHPLAVYPTLLDNHLNVSSGIDLGPEGVSFHNIAIDLGRIDRVDEMRILVRDAAGNILRNGGGPVTWDAYTSQDGNVWTPLVARTTFNAPLSLYAIDFDLTNGRWFKVVSFGVNSESTFVTEVQAYYHAAIEPGKQRSSTQNFYNGLTSITARPWDKLTLTYTGSYSSVEQDIAANNLRTSDFEHVADVQYDWRKWLSLRGQYVTRQTRGFGTNDSVDGITTYVDWTPTTQLRTTLEISRQNQTLSGRLFTIDTNAIHASAFLLKSVFLGLEVGTQHQTFADAAPAADRQYLTLTGNVQWLPTLRMLLNATMQRNDTRSSDPASQLLGPSRDNRASSEFIWRPGLPLVVSARFGHVSGAAVTGFTQRYHVDWHPFADGTVSLGGSYDHDIDPTSNRRATRMVVNPRWTMNRFVMFDINYTAVSTSYTAFVNRQHTLFATLTLTR